jgi:hypothetical protein
MDQQPYAPLKIIMFSKSFVMDIIRDNAEKPAAT